MACAQPHNLSPLSAPAGGRSPSSSPTATALWRHASKINDLFEQESPGGQLYVKLKELGIPVEREWWIDEQGIAYIVDLAFPIENGWLPVSFGDRPWPAGGLRFAAEAEPQTCIRKIRDRLQIS